MDNEFFDEETVRKFYRFFKHKKPTEIRVFDEKKYPSGKSIFVKTEDEFVEKCRFYSIDEKVSVYIGARDRVGKSDKDVVSSNFIFFEIDEHDTGNAEDKISERDKIIKFLEDNGINVTMQGMSGAGYHFYIMHMNEIFNDDEARKNYKDNALGSFKKVLQDNGFDIDGAVFNLSRVSRVLGTYNYKWNKISKLISIDKHVDVQKNTEALQKLVVSHIKKTEPIVSSSIGLEEDSIIGDIKKNWTVGNRQDLTMSLAGYLRKVKRMGLNNAINTVVQICQDCGDTDVNERIAAVRATYNKDEEEVKGLSGLEEYGITINPEASDEVEDFRLLSLEELKNYEVPEYDWRIQSLIQDKKIIVVSGSSAVYKSWLCILMGLSVSSGQRFLDNFEVEQGGVLFIDRENSIPELKNRVNMLSAGANIETANLPMYFLSEQSIRLDKEDSLIKLEKIIKESGIKMVVIDVYRRVIGFEENDANSVSFFFTSCLKPICERTGASFVLIHHHKKGNGHTTDEKEMLRGSSDLVNFVDGIVQINRRGNFLTVKQTKNRSAKELDPFELEIKTDEETYLRFEYHKEPTDKSFTAKTIDVILDWINSNGYDEFKFTDVVDMCAANNIKRTSVYYTIKDMEKKGIIEKSIKRGVWRIRDTQKELE